MDLINVLNKLNAKHNGTWFTCEWDSELPLTAKAKREGHVAIKHVHAQCRKGIRYSAIKVIKESGKALSHELPWGKWKISNLIIEHNGNDYARLYFGPNKTKVIYELDGKICSYEELVNSNLFVKSFAKEGGPTPLITINVNKITRIV